MVGFWKNPDDLDSKFIKALQKEFNLHSRTGWVRASELPSNELSNELLRLTTENKKLKEMLNEINPLLNENTEKTDEIINILKNHKVDLEVRFEATPSKWEVVRKLPLWSIFEQIMLTISPVNNTSLYLNNELAFIFTPKSAYTKKKNALIKNRNRIPGNIFNEWLQLIASMGLIKNEYENNLPTNRWQITDFGRNLYLYQCRMDLKNRK